MAAICGILGKRDPGAVDAMANALAVRAIVEHRVEGDRYLVAASHAIAASPCLLDGRPLDSSGQPIEFERACRSLQTMPKPSALEFRGGFAGAVLRDGGAGWWLVRDRLGRRPLFYYQGADFLVFASELKALLASGLVPRRLNLAGVDQYLTLRCVPGSATIVQDVQHVLPGHVVEYRDGVVQTTQFAGFDLTTREQSREEAAVRLAELLRGALSRSSADLLLWSSGIDSASLAAFAPRLKPIFISLERSWQDESRLATESARLMERPLQLCPGRRVTEESFHRAVACADQPIADASLLPLWTVIEAAAEQGTRLVSGHGADELLGGYPRYHFLQKAQGAQRLVPAGLISDMLPALPPNAFVQRASRSLASIHDLEQSYLSLVSVFDRDEREQLYTDAMKSALYDLGEMPPAVSDHFTQPDLTRSVLDLDLRIGLPKLLVTKCDRFSAAHGVTLDLPFLDDALIDFALTLPPDVKFGVRSKPVLRLALKGLLPGSVRLRARRDFKMPQSGRVLSVLEAVAKQTITPDRVDATGLFRWHVVESIVRSAQHNVYRRRQFWALLMFFAWYRNVMER